MLLMPQGRIEIRLSMDTSTGSPLPESGEPVADPEYERHVLTTPGVAEAADAVYELIEEWKRSL